ncbi:ABC transporter substrate-binding protein [Janibacter sp. DB-40]|uniref:ABC transporter substrate-binding protein n=1 Tax=Janibacter sp. DB-40 TaxID=3028808 RepID=UPI0024072949|nr:ABC transporter substrate-binding protein [Janibacter sp. DB-40]
MRRSTRGTLAVLTSLALAGAVGCSSDLVSGLADSSSSSDTSTASGSVTGPDDRLTVLAAGPVRAWDPQRITDRRAAGFASRTWMRTLTAYQPDSALSAQRTISGDLARGTGEPNDDASRWTFSLRDGVTWQDGSTITCEDVRHGVARSFDPEVSSSGYALTYLDIPKESDGSSTYPGPTGKEGQSKKARTLIDEAVECPDPSTVVFHLSQPVGNFDEIVSLPEFAPVKADQAEKGATYRAYSSGPYMLQDGWTPSKGGTWVRNPEWKPTSDPLRRPGPASIVHKEGVAPKEALSTIIEGKDGGRTLALDPMPPALDEAIREAGPLVQSVDTDGQLVDYLAVNAESKALQSSDVRRALAAATDREAYAASMGTGRATWSLLGTALPSAHETVLDHGPQGSTEAAKKLVSKADVETPIELTLVHRDTEDLAAALEELLPGWRAAGFDVTLEPVDEEEYFTTISSRSTVEEHDLVWANWGPDHPSAATVLPPLFDDRVNLSKKSVGRDYGQYADKEINEAMDEATGTRDDPDRAEEWATIDTELLEDVAYLPLSQSRLTHVAGSEVTSFVANPVYGGIPELGLVGVTQ